jgi:nucleotide-binding universal stress UspA family protein
MSHVDQFESAFRSAIRPIYQPHAITLRRVLVVTDLSPEEAKVLEQSVQEYLHGLSPTGFSIEWDCLTNESFDSTASLLSKVETLSPDLICTYRNLNTADWRYENSIGSRLDTLINQSTIPVLVIPHPKPNTENIYTLNRNKTVVAITDHLTDDHQLIDYSSAFLERPGKLVLVHLEDQLTFDRYLDAISRITTIDTENARQQLASQLLKGPEAFVQSCRERLANSGIDVTKIVEFANGIDRFKETIHELETDLLVMKGIDHDQTGIHGLAQRLINETRRIPILVI